MAKNVLEEFVSILGWEIDDQDLESYQNTLDGVKKATAAMLKATAAAVAAVSGYVVMANTATARNKAFADSYGVNVEFLENFSNAIKPLGFDIEKVGDLVEELNNKMGESTGLGQPVTAVKEGLRILKLNYQDLKQLAPEEQFKKIIDAALQLEDQQQAVSAVDMLSGAEANRIIGYLRAQGLSLTEILDKYKELNFLTDEGRKGAEDFNNILNDVKIIVTTIGSEFAGLAGEGLTPLLKDLKEYILANRELIKVKIKEYVEKAVEVLESFYKILSSTVIIVYDLIDAVGGLKGSFFLIASFMAGSLTAKTVSFFSKYIDMADLAGTKTALITKGLPALKTALAGIGWSAAFYAGYLIIDDLIAWARGGESFIGQMSKEAENYFEMADRWVAENIFGQSLEEFQYSMITTIRRVKQAFSTLSEFWNGLSHEGDLIINKLSESVSSFLSGMWEEMNAVMNGYWDTAANLFNAVKEAGASALDYIVSFISSTFYEEIAAIKKGIQDLVSFLPDSIKSKVSSFLNLETGSSVSGSVGKESTGGSVGGLASEASSFKVPSFNPVSSPFGGQPVSYSNSQVSSSTNSSNSKVENKYSVTNGNTSVTNNFTGVSDTDRRRIVSDILSELDRRDRQTFEDINTGRKW